MSALSQAYKVGKTAMALQMGASKLSALSAVPDLTAIAFRRQFGKRRMTDAVVMSMVKGYVKRQVVNTTTSAAKKIMALMPKRKHRFSLFR